MNTEDTDKSSKKSFGEGACDALVDGDLGKAIRSLGEDLKDILTPPAKKYVESGKKYVETVKKQIHDHVTDEAVKHIVNEGKDIIKRNKGTIGLVCLYTAVAYLIFRRR